MSSTRFVSSALLLALCSTGAAIAAPGDPDLSWGFFGSAGKQFVSFDLDAVAADQSSDSVAGPDGSLYLAGTVRDAQGLQRIGVAKLDPDGQLDTTFSADGKATSNLTNVVATAVALDGANLYVAGYTTNNSPDLDMVLCRFGAVSGANANFPNNGGSNCVKPITLAGTQDIARAILVQPDGKIVIAGSVGVNSPTDTYAAFARFEANGQPDTTFGTLQGSNLSLIRNNVVSQRSNINAITRTSNGTLVGVGSTVFNGDSDAWALVIRLPEDGSNEPGAEYPFSRDESDSRDTVLNDVVALDDPDSAEDFLVVAGSVELTGGTSSGLLAMVNSTSNVLKGTFGEQADFTALTLPNATLVFTDVALDGNRSIITHGQMVSANGLDMLVRRFDLSGFRDSTFGNAGNAVIDFGTPSNINQPSGLVVQGDAIYATGSFLWTGSNYDFGAAKLTLSDALFSDGFED